MLSFFGLFSGNFPLIGILVSFVSIVLSSLVLNMVLSKQISPYAGLAGGIVFLFFPMFYRVIDMETNFLIFLVIVSLFLFSEKKYWAAFFFTGLYLYTLGMIQHYFIWVSLFFIGLAFSLRYVVKLDFFRVYLIWSVLYIFSFSVLNVPLFIWYYILALAIIPVFLVTGFHTILKFLGERLKSRAVAVYVSAVLLSSIAIFGVNGIFNFFYGQWYFKHIPHQEKLETYREVARYIEKNIPKEKSIATEEIGLLGYYIDNKIWDFYCLVHEAKQFPHYFPVESKNRIPYLLTLMDPDYILVSSYRWDTSVVFQNYHKKSIFKVDEYKENPDFYFVLLEKKPDQLVILGGITLKKQVSGIIGIEGWVFGKEPVNAVELAIEDRVISETGTFYDSPTGFIDYFRFNPFARKAAFKIQLDSSKLSNGKWELIFRARSGSKSGIFARKRVIIAN